MQDLMKTELLTITVNPLKQRMYWTMQGFWQEDAEKAAHLQAVVQQLSQQMPRESTVVLDTTRLRIMDPYIADRFLKAFITFLLDNHVKALAHVGDPKNVVLKMQFQRVLRGIEKANEVQHQGFLERQDAENWLDMIGMSHDGRTLTKEARSLDAVRSQIDESFQHWRAALT